MSFQSSYTFDSVSCLVMGYYAYLNQKFDTLVQARLFCAGPMLRLSCKLFGARASNMITARQGDREGYRFTGRVCGLCCK